MITIETKELAQLAYDAYFERIGIEPIQLDEIPPKVRDAWIASVAAIKAEVERRYAYSPIPERPSTSEPEQASKENTLPIGFIALPTNDGRTLYVRALDITSIIADHEEESVCWMHVKDGVYRCERTAEDIVLMIAKAIKNSQGARKENYN